VTKIERIMAAINFKRVDRIPKGEFHLEDDFVTELLSLTEKVIFNDRVEACELLGLDSLALAPSYILQDKSRAWEGLKQWRKETDFFIFAIIDGPFQGAAKLFNSFTDYLLAIAQHDPIVPELVTKSVAANVELGLNALASGANGIIIADDIAYQGGTFISPKALRENFFPGLEEQVEVLNGDKVPVFFHADGDLLTVLDDIMDAGVGGLHSLDFSSLTDIANVRMATNNRLCLMGGYDLGWFEADNRTEKALELLTATSNGAMGSGYIFGSSAGILGNTISAKRVNDVYQYVSNLPVV